jgi:hypothetical protein
MKKKKKKKRKKLHPKKHQKRRMMKKLNKMRQKKMNYGKMVCRYQIGYKILEIIKKIVKIFSLF